jgi:hypothetical protein
MIPVITDTKAAPDQIGHALGSPDRRREPVGFGALRELAWVGVQDADEGGCSDPVLGAGRLRPTPSECSLRDGAR